MQAVVMRNAELSVDTLPDPQPLSGEVLVKTLACGICGSDLHALKNHEAFSANSPASMGGGLNADEPLVMGHEFCAEILDYGPNCGERLPVGTRVCSVPGVVREQNFLTVGYSHDVPGGYGERMVLMEGLLLPVPNGLATERAALTEPMAVGWHAVEMANLTSEDVPLVVGCGPVGLAVIASLKLKGVAPIIAADFSAKRRELAITMGADKVVNPAELSPYESWLEVASASVQGARAEVNLLTGERNPPAGVFFECVGVPGVIDQMLVGAHRGCRFVVVGVCMEQDHLTPLLAITKEINMQFVLGYTPEEFAATLHNIAEGKIPTDPLITGKTGVSGVANAFRDLGNPELHAKILVEPWRE